MTDTIVSYHTDGFTRPHRPAVNVKVHGFDRAAFERLALALGEDYDLGEHAPKADAYYQGAEEQVYEAFWMDAEAMAADLGLGPIEQEGRSGGWLVLTDGRDPQDGSMACVNHRYGVSERCVACLAIRKAWLTRYRKLREWCEAEVKAAPDRIAALALDQATERVLSHSVAVRGMLAFEGVRP